MTEEGLDRRDFGRYKHPKILSDSSARREAVFTVAMRFSAGTSLLGVFGSLAIAVGFFRNSGEKKICEAL